MLKIGKYVIYIHIHLYCHIHTYTFIYNTYIHIYLYVHKKYQEGCKLIIVASLGEGHMFCTVIYVVHYLKSSKKIFFKLKTCLLKDKR
jgi:hypothetical protein